MIAAKLIALMGAALSARFITEHHYSPSGDTQAVSFTGAVAGNLALVVCIYNNNGDPTTPTGWSVVSSFVEPSTGRQDTVYSKVLTSGDISTGSATFDALVGSTSQVMAVFYSGPTVATAVSTNDDAASTTVPLTGFTKSASCRAIITWATHTGTTLFSPPSGSMARVATYANSATAAGCAEVIPVTYANGTTLTWTGFASAHGVGQIIELT